AARGASVRGDRRQGRHYAGGHWGGDRRIRWFERGSRLSAAERHLAARHAAGFRRAVRLVRARDIGLCAGGGGGKIDVGVAAAGPRPSLSVAGDCAVGEIEGMESKMPDQKMVPPMPAGMASLDEVLLQSNDIPWRAKSLAGVSEKMLWRDEKLGSSI